MAANPALAGANIIFQVADAEAYRLPLNANRYDAILTVSLHLMVDPGAVAAAAVRWLTYGGFFMVALPQVYIGSALSGVYVVQAGVCNIPDNNDHH
jgi:hypothetical protein